MAKKEKLSTNQKNRFLTINFNNEFIKCVELSKTNKGLIVHKLFSITMPERAYRDGIIRDRNAIAKELTIALQRNGVQTTNTIFTISSSKIATKEVIIPAVKPNKVAALVKSNATDYFPVNIEEYVIDHTVLETIVNPDDKKDKKLKLLVIAVPSKMIEDYYDFASTAGLKVASIDYLGNSTLQILRTQSDVESSVMIQIENDSTIISVFENDILQLQRTVPYGKTMVVKAVMEKRKIYSYDVALDILTKETLVHPEFDGDEVTESMKFLVNNVQRIMDYQSSRNSGKPIEKAYIVGNATLILGLEDLFKNSLNAPVESISFLKGVTADKKTYIEETHLTTYIANIGAVIDPIGFTPKSMAVESTTSRGGNSSDAMAGLLNALTILGIVAAVFFVVVPLYQRNKAASERDEAQAELDRVVVIEQVLEEFNAAKTAYNDVNDFYQLSRNEYDIIPSFIADMEKILPQGVCLNSFEFNNAEEGLVSFKGTSTNKTAVAKFLLQAEELTTAYGNASFVSTIDDVIDENEEEIVEFQCTIILKNDELENRGYVSKAENGEAASSGEGVTEETQAAPAN
ncbi:MAG: pilus assembly protein PilM [Lachnospiraceae bacterium]|nr:pilus assembly protein PilM [Lachnospiraceae bacterium]